MRQQFRLAVMAAAMGAGLAGNATAAGFQLQNQTGSGNGNAFAGAAATAEDAGTIFFNPAGMTRLPEGHSLSVAGTLLNRTVEFRDGSTSGALPAPSASNGKDAGGLSLIPAFYWSYALNPTTRLGIGVSPTFGNKTDYGFDFIGRYSGYFAEIRQINVNPSVAFKVNEQLSVGFGLNYAKNETEFRQGSPLPSPLANNNVTVKGDDAAVGYNAGVLWQLQPQTRLALTYRSQLKFRLDGDLNSNLTPAVDNQVNARLTTPASSSLALAHQLSDKVELLADLTWTGWSVIKSLNVVDSATGTTLNSLSYNFQDTWRVGLGANYQYNDQWKLRVGTAWDQSPVKSAADRTMTLPDSDRLWLAFGAKYKIDERQSVDFGYAHIFFDNASTARAVRNGAGATVQTISGVWRNNSADLLSVQWNYRF